MEGISADTPMELKILRKADSEAEAAAVPDLMCYFTKVCRCPRKAPQINPR